MNSKILTFEDNPAALAKPDHYIFITLDVGKALKSYKSSLYSFEWLRPDGSIKDMTELSAADQAKRKAVEDLIKAGAPLMRPVLGIGMLDNIEIGSGRTEFMLTAASGADTITVHIPKSCEKDFKSFKTV